LVSDKEKKWKKFLFQRKRWKWQKKKRICG